MDSPGVGNTAFQHILLKAVGSTVEELCDGAKERLLAAASRCTPLLARPALLNDKWICSSAVQKLVRRGEAAAASSAALALHRLDPAYLPRRLPIIAFEDVGIGDIGACIDVLVVFGNQQFPSGTKEAERRKLLIGVVATLAHATKSRAACDIFCLAHADAEHARAAARFARSSESSLAAMAADRGAALTSRALALHLLMGMTVRDGRWERRLSRFSEKGLTVVADRLALPEAVAWLMVGGRNTAGLAAMLPLVWEGVHQSADLHIEESKLPTQKSILGLPPYAADMYTRIGRKAIAEYATAIADRYPDYFQNVRGLGRAKLVQMALFHTEGSKLDRRIENTTLADYREQIEEIELRSLGLPDRLSQRALYEVLETERHLLWSVRRSHMIAAFRRSHEATDA